MGQLVRGQWIESGRVPFAPVAAGLVMSSQALTGDPAQADLARIRPWTCVDVYCNPQNSASSENALVRVFGVSNGLRAEVARGRITLAKGPQLVASVRGAGADYYEVTLQSANLATAKQNDPPFVGSPPQIQLSMVCWGHEALNRAPTPVKYSPVSNPVLDTIVASGGQAVPVYCYEANATNTTGTDAWMFVTDAAGNVLCPAIFVPQEGGVGSMSLDQDRPLFSPAGLVLRASSTDDVVTPVAGLVMQAGYA